MKSNNPFNLKGKALKRAAKTKDVYRLIDDIPLITDETVLITPEKAKKMLEKNKKNRPIKWNKVEEYADIMRKGEWKLHAQGIILDSEGNILTGQNRLIAIIYSGTDQYMRVSYGTPTEMAQYIDRGTPQSSRDLATRKTERKHSPTESSIVRAICIIKGNFKPNTDAISDGIIEFSGILDNSIRMTKGIKKSKAMIMIIAAICFEDKNSNLDEELRKYLYGEIEILAEKLEEELKPIEIDRCWNRGPAFILAMDKALKIIKNIIHKKSIKNDTDFADTHNAA